MYIGPSKCIALAERSRKFTQTSGYYATCAAAAVDPEVNDIQYCGPTDGC